jgi:hypothetical protein
MELPTFTHSMRQAGVAAILKEIPTLSTLGEAHMKRLGYSVINVVRAVLLEQARLERLKSLGVDTSNMSLCKRTRKDYAARRDKARFRAIAER